MPPRFCPDCDDLLRDAERPRDADYVICPGCRAKVYDDGAVSRPKKKKKTPGRSRGRSSSRGWMFAVGGLVLGFVLLVGALILVSRSRRSDLSPVALRDARAGFTTKLIPNEYEADGPAPAPPPEAGLRLVKYRSPVGDLAAYVTAGADGGAKRPAVVWAHGGFGGIGDDAWEPDGDTAAFAQAGFVVVHPSWRGENDNPGPFELFLGEVDDAVAAVDYAAGLPGVDPARVYLAGHSTGGTIALLAAGVSDKVRCAFSLGGAPDVGRLLVATHGVGFGNTPFDWKDKKEREVRTPIRFVNHLKAPVFYFEGAEDSDYVGDARRMESLAKKAGRSLTTFIVPKNDHFSIVGPVTKLIAEKVAADTGPTCGIVITEEEVNKAFTQTARRGRGR
jgi:dipeptidyl aminopeptidase/acylaminoacyl peptidase